MPRLQRIFQDTIFLRLIDRGERLVAKLLAAVLFLVLAVAALKFTVEVVVQLFDPARRWVGEGLIAVLGDLLNLLIAIEVLQNITSYLRRHVVQIELVLLTAITAVARKVIVLPPNAENKPMLVVGLGVAVVCLAAAFWMVRRVNESEVSQRDGASRTGPARSFQEPGHSPAAGAAGPH
ncbi:MULTISPECIES: phosphate-starvation-inducible PsiE family protein [unclassified Cyanobium]|uniref:phosphate-starvation-inducible PsiE family protein n=1 Tax=unclassified Cyanobium TaxID=2627006 RepID=UPI0020CF0873|nr:MULTISPECIES: phosphate-starvation-inducible PsiE family protein [unclassified Cyanobium]MCP9833032.1 phosphate-starvation-inducible PsiE family protein [Cyanobium sp. La Preciosa 7G6]MCP9935782.1 phosphate-starvation-inducible PsiE family protein [Cyanobium sp. Aljojuca 7A6]